MYAITYSRISRSIQTLNVEQPQQVLAKSAAEIIRYVVMVYQGTRLLLVALSVTPLLPASWRAALVALIAALDALALTPAASVETAAGDLDPGTSTDPTFKAGKDL